MWSHIERFVKWCGHTLRFDNCSVVTIEVGVGNSEVMVATTQGATLAMWPHAEYLWSHHWCVLNIFCRCGGV